MWSPGQPGSRERRGAGARAGAQWGGGWKPGSGPRGPSNPRAWAAAPDALLGAPRRGRSPRGGQAVAPPCGASAQPGLLPAPGQAGPSASDLQLAGPSEGAASRLRSWAGPESSDRAGPSRHEGSIIHGAPGRAPKTRSALSFSGEAGRRQGKSSQSKVGHISHFLKWPGLGTPMSDQGGKGVVSGTGLKCEDWLQRPHQWSCSRPEEQTGIRREWAL